MKSFSHRQVVSILALLAVTLIPGLALGSNTQVPNPEARARGGQMLHGHVPVAVGHFQPIGLPLATSQLYLAIGLPLRNQEALGNLLHDLYDPASPKYRQYLTPEQFTEQFGPTKDDYQAVINFAKANGLKVTAIHPNRVLLNVDGAVADIERTLHVTMRLYQHPMEARTFYAPDVEPSLDLTVPILHINGLDNYTKPFPKLVRKPVTQPALAIPYSGSASNGSYWGSDFRNAYVPGTSLSGSNQSVALFELDGYYAVDITNYWAKSGLSNSFPFVPLVNVGSVTPGVNSGVDEVSLDIECAIGMAPGLSHIYVYEGTDPDTVLNNIVNDNLAHQISCSWGWTPGPDTLADDRFAQMAAQGQSFFNASGDSDAYAPGGSADTYAPTTSTNITQVGGTTLTTGSGATYSSETVWNWGGGEGSSGGISTNYAIPYYQQGVSMTANYGSTSKRNVPDVALTADNIYVVANKGKDNGIFGGTSCAAPLWAAFTALVNQQIASSGSTNWVGFLNPAIYTIGKGSGLNYSNCFHDITTGNNGTSTQYPAVSGYDLCTGWGTPNGTNLINALAGLAQSTPILSVSPAGGLTATGNVGGSFSPGSQTYAVSNTGTSNLNWTASNSATWLSLSATSGSLVAGASTNVTAFINANANSLSAGTYSDTLSFSNVVNGNGNTTRLVTLTVNAIAPVIAANGSTLAAESCAPTNGLVDPGETVTVSLAVTNVGTAGTANLVGTLLAANGVTSPSSAQTYGAVAPGAAVSRSFTFTATGVCGSTIMPTLLLQDGTTNLSTITYTIALGQITTPLSQNFDNVTVPALPSGWATSASGSQSNWVTSTAAFDSSPNAAFSADNSATGANELDSPSIAISSASAQLTFRQNYSLTASSTNPAIGYDGGVLEIKVGSGSYADILAAGGSFVSGGYNTTLSSSYGNPLAGHAAWSGNSGGFTTTVVNLPAAAAGQNVQLRWRCGAGSPPTSPYVVRPLASSGTLAYWSFDASTATPDTVASNLSVAPVTVSNVGGSLTYFSGNPGKAIASVGFTTSAGPPTTSYSYFAFAITVSNGFQAALSSLSLDAQRSGTGPTNFTIQASQQASFSSVIYDSGVKTAGTSFATTTLTLTNSALTGTIYFRVYAYKAGGSGGTLRIDNLTVQGSVGSAGPAGPGGWYIDTVSVSDPSCCSGTTAVPVALFSGDPTTGTAPLNVSFTDSSSGSPTSWAWDFGDGNTSTAQNPSNTYAAGTWTVRLIASNAGGSSTNTKANYITVLTPFQSWQNHYWADGASDVNAAPDLDPYGKGISNTNQFLAGFNPTNTAAYLRIINIVATNNNVTVTYLGANGDNSYSGGPTSRTNVLECATSTSDGSYSNNFLSTGQTNVLSGGDGSGVVTNMTDNGGATNMPSRYYRIRVLVL
jgi:PKD repeat protein